MIRKCEIGNGVKIWQPQLVNLYECEIGDNCHIGAFVEIGRGVKIGKNCLIQAHSYIPEGVIIEDDVFIAPGVKFSNDKYPPSGKIWATLVKKGASIGLGANIVCGITIGENAKIAAGATVTQDVPDNCFVCGNPAKKSRSKRWEDESSNRNRG